jgi:hypothetical protein
LTLLLCMHISFEEARTANAEYEEDRGEGSKESVDTCARNGLPC